MLADARARVKWRFGKAIAENPKRKTLPCDAPVGSCATPVRPEVSVCACDSARTGCCCCCATRSEAPADCVRCGVDANCVACPADGDGGAERVLGTPPSAWVECGLRIAPFRISRSCSRSSRNSYINFIPHSMMGEKWRIN